MGLNQGCLFKSSLLHIRVKLRAYYPKIYRYTVLLGAAAAAIADYTGQLHVGRSGG